MTLELRDVAFSYKNKHGATNKVLEAVNFSVQQGECVGIIGQEGAGKTTLLQLMVGLLKPGSGAVLFNDVDVWREPGAISKLRRGIGFAFQFPEQQFFCETVEDELLYSLKNSGDHQGFPKPDDVLKMMNLKPDLYLRRSPFSLSMGEARRVAMATLLMTRPQALLLDEPTVGLDGAGVYIMLDLLQRMTAEGTAIVIVSHEIDVLAETASRILIVGDGNILEDGPVQTVLTNKDLLDTHGYQLPEVVRFMAEQGQGATGKFYRFSEAKRVLQSILDRDL